MRRFGISYSEASTQAFITKSKIYKILFFSAIAHAHYPREKAKERADDLHIAIICKVGSRAHRNAVFAKALGDGGVLFD